MTTYPWLKLWNEAPTDPKWLAVADMAGSSPALAWHTFSAALAYANEHPNRGSIVGFNPQIVASFCRVAVDEVRRVIQVFHEIGLLLGERIAKWQKRQTEKLPKPRSPGAERQARHRQKRAQAAFQFPPMTMTREAPEAPVTLEPEASQIGVTSVVEREEDYSEASASELGHLTTPVIEIADYKRGEKGRVRGTRRSRIAPDWQPSEADREYAEGRGYDREWIEQQAERFRDNHLKKASLFADWHAAWRNWVQTAADFAGSNSARRSPDYRDGDSPWTIAMRRVLAQGESRMAF